MADPEPNTQPTTPVSEKPGQKAKEKPKCQHCGREMPNAGAKKMHEKACEKNPNRTPKKSKAAKPEVKAGDAGDTTPKKSGSGKSWWDTPIF